jgi:hypothetical protein
VIVIFHASAFLSLKSNSLMGTIPIEVTRLTLLSKSISIWILVVAAKCCHALLLCVLVIFHHSCTASMSFHENSLTGTMPSNIGSLTALSECCMFVCHDSCSHVI